MNKKITKGCAGYLDNKKIKQIVYTLIFMLMVALFFFTGYIRYHSTKTIFTVFAVLAVLPAAKQAVIYIVLIPYHSVDKNKYNTINEIASHNNIVLIADMVLTSEEKVSNLDMACIKGGHIAGYVTNQKTDISFATGYIKKFISPKYKVNAIKLYTDFSKFQKAVEEMADIEASRYDEEIAELMLAYSV